MEVLSFGEIASVEIVEADQIINVQLFVLVAELPGILQRLLQ